MSQQMNERPYFETKVEDLLQKLKASSLSFDIAKADLNIAMGDEAKQTYINLMNEAEREYNAVSQELYDRNLLPRWNKEIREYEIVTLSPTN